MPVWLSNLLDDIFIFLTWGHQYKKGFLVEEMTSEGVYYFIHDHEGRELRVEQKNAHNSMVLAMKRAGVAIIPYEAQKDIWAGRKTLKELLEEYSSKKNG